ncbi:MAG: polysaccharide deacetylase family protein, partial [Crocinitomicaceae bacterium]|nr:polysaccharide deacetylase family protein [Crocinitomicaceae bacterium]
RALIRSIHADHAVGLHPGIGSHEDIAVLKTEINRLSEITGKPVTSSRLHYLKFSLPETYRHLYECGITDDYSMGYASDVGFRAGTSLPFRWYDVKKETVTPLVIHPFVCMDATFKNYLKIRQAEAEKQIRDLLYEVKKTNGRFVSLWHNESLADSKEWAGYKNLYSAMLNMAQ